LIILLGIKLASAGLHVSSDAELAFYSYLMCLWL